MKLLKFICRQLTAWVLFGLAAWSFYLITIYSGDQTVWYANQGILLLVCGMIVEFNIDEN